MSNRMWAAPDNKALHQTRRGGAAAARPVVEARLAGEGRCWAGLRGTSPVRWQNCEERG